MVLKLFKAFWFASVMAVMINLLFVYAGLPEQVVVQEETGARILADRELFFYLVTFILIIINALVYLFSKLYSEQEHFRAWFHGLIITMNIFFILALNVVQVYNSAEKFDFSRIGFVIYASLVLMICWAATWPLYSIYRRLFAKEAVL